MTEPPRQQDVSSTVRHEPSPGADLGTLTPGIPAPVRPDADSRQSAEATVDAPGPAKPDVPPELRHLTKYEVMGELGRGGMGAVYKVREKALGRIVALKIILGSASGQSLDRFMVEARAAARLNHPGIVPIFEIDKVGNVPYFTMAYIEGGSLAGILKTGGPLAATRAAQIIRQVAQAVDYAHQNNIIHRDLKPDNILIDAQGHARLTDFGLAKDQQSGQNLTNTGAVLGTPSFMAPEQARGEAKSAGTSVDIYALGGILYACLAGCPPFSGESLFDIIIKVAQDEPVRPSALVQSVPAELEAICLRCLAKNPADRYPSAAAVAAAVDAWLTQVNASTVMTAVPGTPAVGPGSAPKTQAQLGLPTQNAAGGSVTVTRHQTAATPPSPAPAPAPAGGPLVPVLIGGGAVVAILLGVIGYLASRPPAAAVVQPGPQSAVGPTPAPPVDPPPAVSPQPAAGGRPAAASPRAAEPGVVPLEPAEVVRNDFGLSVDMIGHAKAEKGKFVVPAGSAFRFRLSVHKDAHVSIWTIGPDGEVVQLFPNDHDADSLVRAGVPRLVPDPAKDYKIEPEASTGNETLRFMATAKPLNKGSGQKVGGFTVYKTATEKDSLTQVIDGGVRGLKVITSKPTLSEFFIGYRVLPQ